MANRLSALKERLFQIHLLPNMNDELKPAIEPNINENRAEPVNLSPTKKHTYEKVVFKKPKIRNFKNLFGKN